MKKFSSCRTPSKSTGRRIVRQKPGSNSARNCNRTDTRWKSESSEMETQLQRLFVEWDALQDRGEATRQARAGRDRMLKQMREILSNRTYVKNIVNDLVATIG